MNLTAPAYRFCAIGGRATRCGSGYCAPEGSYCICDPGYEHDRINRFHDNCLVPTLAKQIALAFVGALGLVACGVALYEIFRSQRKAIALDILKCASVGGVLSSLYCLAIGLEGRHGPASCVLIILLYWTMGIAAIERLLWSFMSPIFAVTNTNSKAYMRNLRLGMFTIGLAFTFVYLAAIVFDARSDKDNYNVVVTVGLIIIIIEVTFVGVMLVRKLKELLQTIDKTLELANGIRIGDEPASSPRSGKDSNTRNEDPVRRYRQQAVCLTRRVKISGWSIGLSAFLLVVLDLLFKVYPFRFIPYLIIVVNFPIFCIVLTLYCKRSLVKTSSVVATGTALRDSKEAAVVCNPGVKESSDAVTASQLVPHASPQADPTSL